MKQRQNTEENLEFDMFEYAKGERGLLPVLIPKAMLQTLQYVPAFISLKGDINFISDSSSLGKTLFLIIE
jgi:hypothetical protein